MKAVFFDFYKKNPFNNPVVPKPLDNIGCLLSFFLVAVGCQTLIQRYHTGIYCYPCMIWYVSLCNMIYLYSLMHIDVHEGK
jgi:hypothetical protein